MRALKLALAVSLLFNLLVLAGYLYGRLAMPADDPVVAELNLQPAQVERLAELRSQVRERLRRARTELGPHLAELVAAARTAEPGSDRLEPVLRGLAEARLANQLELARAVVAFRAGLGPSQQAEFNRRLGRPGFVLDLLGFGRVASLLRTLPGLESPIFKP
ncbi:hypothetical protein EZJ19_15470 [Parasulfuritortus cantonensis]|uniref:Periplasmic heavy metal sensor n=1 Tax=Parasulfuritortus cantonensis TaxID=2528202 RepID=A0A4R1B293_9PROT|nr:Spy/CpxP family protein refolding chaperone [Parasulfuritortus cantonensis]TCJ11550.1 hypothetical protein EZJ19_15470 [Parasulfuritortus cantonensis]